MIFLPRAIGTLSRVGQLSYDIKMWKTLSITERISPNLLISLISEERE